MSTTTTASSSSQTCSSGSGSIYVLPTQDSACALPNTNNASSIMDKCCSPASVESYSDDCGLYCLAQKQSLGDLLDCLTDNGAKNGDVFCNDKLNATATADVTGSATKTGDSSDPTSTDSGAGSVSKGGLGLLGIVLGATVLGAF